MLNPFRWRRERRAEIDAEAEKMIAEVGAIWAIRAAHARFCAGKLPLSEGKHYHHVTLRIAQKAGIPLTWGR